MNLKEQYTKMVEKEVKSFRKAVEKIEKSDNPKYHLEGAREYEAMQKRAELDAKIESLNAEYDTKLEEALTAARYSASKERLIPTPSDKAFITTITDELASDLAFASYDGARDEAFAKYIAHFEFMSPAQRYEAKLQLPKVLDRVSDDYSVRELRGINGILSDFKTDAAERLEELEQMAKSRPDYPYRVLTMTNRYYKDKQRARRRI